MGNWGYTLYKWSYFHPIIYLKLVSTWPTFVGVFLKISQEVHGSMVMINGL